MSEHLSVFSLSIAAGRAEPTYPFLSPFGGGRVSPGARLYGLVDSAWHPDADAARRGLIVLRRRVTNSRGSLTATMERAVVAASKEASKGLPSPEEGGQPWVSVTCVALRGDDVYVVRFGRGAVYHYRGGRVLQPDAASPPEEIWLDRFVLAPGDALLVGTSGLRELLSPATQTAVLAAQPDEAARRIYLLGRELPRLSTLFIRARDTPS